MLLDKAWSLAQEAGFGIIHNISAIVMAEEPKLKSYIPAMKTRIAEVLGVEESRVGITATTTERLGFVGRAEGIGASAVCLVSADG
jgi:2-C-methyl-D-erythritol 2,4-cyclodiphosphate synthase